MQGTPLTELAWPPPRMSLVTQPGSLGFKQPAATAQRLQQRQQQRLQPRQEAAP